MNRSKLGNWQFADFVHPNEAILRIKVSYSTTLFHQKSFISYQTLMRIQDTAPFRLIKIFTKSI